MSTTMVRPGLPVTPLAPSAGWPDWARAQLDRAAAVAADVPAGRSVASVLQRDWFAPRVFPALFSRRPLVGLYRAAHVGTSAATGRHDVVGADGWWRTWGRSWTPPRSRPGSVRVVFTVDPDRLGPFVGRVTSALEDATLPWSLGVAGEARRVQRAGAAVLDLPGDAAGRAVLDTVLSEVRPVLAPVAPPLCRPLAVGAALAHHPDNGTSFGDHRCHLVALGLRRAGRRDPLVSLAEVFAAHGIDPARPYRSR